LANRRGWIVSTHVYDPAEGTIDRRIGDRHYLMPSLDFVAMDVSLFFISCDVIIRDRESREAAPCSLCLRVSFRSTERESSSILDRSYPVRMIVPR
jgi:hypothetical protein